MKRKTALLLALAAGLETVPAQDAVSPPPAPHERVVVSTTPLGGDPFEQTQSVTILTEEELKLRLEPTLGETLRQEPGLSSTYFGPGASRPVIRGLGEDRIRVLQNGLTTIDVSNVSPDHAVTAEPLTIKVIDVVRGPATLLYGPNTVGGVVNVIDNRVPSETLARPIEGRLEGRGATADALRSGAGLVEFQLGAVVVHLDGFLRETEDVAIPGFARSARLRRAMPLPPGEREPFGELPNSFTETEGGAMGASYVGAHGYHGASFALTDSRYGTVAEKDVTIELEQKRWDVRGAVYHPTAGIKAINYKASYTDYEHIEFEGDEVGTMFEISGFDARLELVHEKVGMLEGVFGYQGQQTAFSALGAEAYLPPTDIGQHALFLFEEITFDQVELQFGGRYDHQSNERSANPAFGPALTRDFHAFSTSAGLLYAPIDPYTIAFSVSYSQRPPTYVELFAQGPHIATNAFEIGDPGLGKENSLAFDLSFRKRSGRVTGAINFFFYDFDGFITAEPTGDFSQPEEEGEEGLPIFEYRAVDAFFAGGEVDLVIHLLEPRAATETTMPSGKEGKGVVPQSTPAFRHDLHLDLKTDYVFTRNRDAGRSLPRIPPFRTSAALVYEYDQRLSARVEGQYVHGQDRTARFELPTDEYFLLGASAGYRVPVGPVELDFYVKGTNLTNEDARLHTSFLKEIAPLAGRGVLFGVRATF